VAQQLVQHAPVLLLLQQQQQQQQLMLGPAQLTAIVQHSAQWSSSAA
jgi:hypothetical protein